MKKFLYLLLPFLLTLAACSDEPAVRIDDYDGIYSDFVLGDEGDGLYEGNITIRILAPDGQEFTRQASHVRSGESSHIKLSVGLREGVYRLLSATRVSSSGTEEFGLGSRIRVSSGGITIIDNYNRRLGCAGTGTKDDPLIISSPTHLFNLMMAVNDYDYNRYITPHTYFRQVTDIDMKSISRSCDAEYGWMPIGADTNTPFRGVYNGGGHSIRNLIIKRSHSGGVGLFGFMIDASVDSLTMQNASVEGQFAVGTIAGASITSGGDKRSSVTITNCSAADCKVSGPETSAMLGSIIGAVDMHTKTLLANCSSNGGSVSGGMSVGGICGGTGIYSMLMLSGCVNRTPVLSCESGAGGLVGSADTLMVVGSHNYADIQGPLNPGKSTAGIGVGGIAGGTGYSWITSSSNYGAVKGYEGVGGIVGSTRIKGSQDDAFLYNQTFLRFCNNTGQVTGTRFVGGAIGEAQAGAYSVVNTGQVSATSYAGGIVGGSSLAVVHNSLNSGRIDARDYVGGIVGKCTWGSLAINQNTAPVTAVTGLAGGIAGRAGNNTVIHYCANFSDVTTGSGFAGGIVGDIGDPRQWSGLDIAECVIGSAECVMGFLGPVLAVTEGSVELAHALEITIKIVEGSAELALQGADYVLVGFSIDEIINPEAEAALEADMKADASQANAENLDLINRGRSAFAISIPSVFAGDISAAYAGKIAALSDWYGIEGNDESFNLAINEKREERAGELEEIAHMSEIRHTVIAGIAVAASTVSFIVAEVATGGAATAAVVAGSAAAIVGGVNAIVKSCNKFEKNAVIISQCFNGGRVAGGSAAPIAGRLCDGSLIHDCLNTSVDAGSKNFVADLHKECHVAHCVDLRDRGSDNSCADALASCIFYTSHQSVGYYINDGSFFASAGSFTSKNDMKYMSLSVGDGCSWCFGPKFPFPNKSEMQN